MSTATQTTDLVIERIFNAPRALVWRAWTEPEHFMKWWGPKIFTCPIAEMDVRAGGKYFWAMRWPDGRMNYSMGEFLEVDPITRITFSHNFADEHRNVVPPSYYGIPGDFAKDVTTTVVLEDLGDKTKMTLYHRGMPAGEFSKMTTQGWNESFDKLAESVE